MHPIHRAYVLLRGGGDLASGVALRLHRSGFNVIITELPQPMAVRRTVSFSEAVYEGQVNIEGVVARQVFSAVEAFELAHGGVIAVFVDPQAAILEQGNFACMVDARLLKIRVEERISKSPLVIGLGPGFICGDNCHAVVETMRGHFLGRVYWQGSALDDTGQPEGDARRVLRAPLDGVLTGYASIGDRVETGQTIAEVDGPAGHMKIIAPFGGILRGLIRPGLPVRKGVKIGDIDQRSQWEYCFSVSEKALAVGGGVLEALLTWNNPARDHLPPE